MTKLDFLNRFILQWFCIRLTRVTRRIQVITKATLYEGSMIDSRTAGLGMAFDEYHYEVTKWWAIQAWVVPTTSYVNAFRYLGKRHFWRISRVVKTIEGSPPPRYFNCRCTLTKETP